MDRQTILIVDDSPTILKIMEREIRPAGYNIVTASSGQKALDILEGIDPLPDLITLDIHMPEIDGFEICQYLQAGSQLNDPRKQAIANIPVILVSAEDSVENREKGYSLGIVNFISKPFSEGSTLKAIKNALKEDEQFGDMRALVVDDSGITRKIICDIFQRHGLTTYEAEDGEKGLEIIRSNSHKIDIIVTDYIMPGISGEEFCKECRKLEGMEWVPVFFVSAIKEKSTVLSFFRAGANDYLPKPFLKEEFRARVIPHLRNSLYLKELNALNAKLKYIAERDGLTKLFNRGHFERAGERFFRHAQETTQELVFLIIDLDFFKKVNDNHGHAFGDLVLQEFAAILEKSVEDKGLAARFGGEEFVVLLPKTTLTAGLEVAERIRQTTEQHIYSDGTIELSKTCSIGVASFLEHKPGKFDQLSSMADTALYQAKENGRNQVKVFDMKMQEETS